MFRKLAVSLAVAGVLSATQASALGLGQIRIKSALNEPLDAEIQLLRVRDLDAQQIQPQMADMDQFAIAGLERSRLLSNVQFRVDVRPNGTGVIHMTSSQPVREPFLNLLVEVNWPSGRLVREYTVLLDPPVFEAAPIAGAAAPVQAPVTVAPTRPAPGPVQSVATQPSRPSAPVDNIRTRATGNQNQVFVETQDTLGQLARRYSPGGGTTLNQMMLALQRKNPHAFPNNNINFLKAGVVLDLPSLEEVRALSAADANREVARQVQAWKTRGSSAEASSAPQTDGSKKKPVAPSESQAPAAPASQPQLKILTAEESVSKQAEDTGGAQETAPSVAAAPEAQALLQRNEALENQLAVTQETVDRVERENAELNEKLTAITQQLDTLQRLLELKDQQMAALQSQLQQVQEQPATPAPAPAPVAARPEGFVETLTANPAYMAGIGAVIGALLVALMGLLRRRKDEAAPYNVEPENGVPATAVAGAAAVAAGAVAAQALADDREDAAQPAEAAAAANADVAAAPTPVSDLDLDMDLDLDLPLDGAAEKEVSEPENDDEFDLSLDGAFEEEALPKDQVADIAQDDDEFDLSFDTELAVDDEAAQEPQQPAAGDDFDDSLDEILGVAMGDEEEAERADLRSGMGQLESLDEPEEEPLDTLESLGLDSVIEASEVPKEPEEEALDFNARGKVDPLDRSEEEAEDYRLSLVQPVLPDEDEDLLARAGAGAAAEAPSVGEPEEASADEEDASETASPAFEFDESDSLAQDETPAGEPAPMAPSFEFDDDFESAAEPVADEVAAEAEASGVAGSGDDFDIDDLLAQAGAELTLEDELEDVAVEAGDAEASEPPAQEAVAEDSKAADDGLSLHPELEELLAAHEAEAEDDAFTLDEDAADDTDLDAMLAALEQGFSDDDETLSDVEEELTANIAHDLGDDESDLDSELEALLGSVDDEIALDESGAEDEDLGMDGLEFLDGTDEVETKLDLARAYIDMEDRDGAKDILSEILKEGSDKQQQEARKLMESLS